LISSKVKVIFFDAAGTLIVPRPSVGRIYAQAAARHGFHIPPQEIDRLFKKTWKKYGGLRTLVPTGTHRKASEKAWWDRFVRETMEPFKMGRHFDDFFNNLYKIFESEKSWQVFPDVKKTLSSLKIKGFRLGVISNWDSRLIPLLKRLDLSRFFDKIIVSSQIGAAKPNPVIFQKAARLLRQSPEGCLHVGNDLEEDYRGALRAGFSAVLLNRTGKSPGRSVRIRSVSELCRII
jgi:putative hydrolase of the HAD superfamily